MANFLHSASFLSHSTFLFISCLKENKIILFSLSFSYISSLSLGSLTLIFSFCEIKLIEPPIPFSTGVRGVTYRNEKIHYIIVSYSFTLFASLLISFSPSSILACVPCWSLSLSSFLKLQRDIKLNPYQCIYSTSTYPYRYEA